MLVDRDKRKNLWKDACMENKTSAQPKIDGDNKTLPTKSQCVKKTEETAFGFGWAD